MRPVTLNTMENNKLIAEFMGMKYSDKRVFIDGNWIHSVSSLTRFCTDWNWLMQVVDKIEDLGYKVGINGISCTVSELLNDEPIISLVLGDRKQKISLVHSAVVEFINYYNSIKN